MIDSHEHLRGEPAYLEHGPDILVNLFSTNGYQTADLIVAGAPPDAVKRLIDASDPDLERRFSAVAPAWERCQRTGYGEAALLIAKHVYGIDQITLDTVLAASYQDAELRQPGERFRLLHDLANLDHVQIANDDWSCLPDQSGLDFFLYDIDIYDLVVGSVDPDRFRREVGVEVTNLRQLEVALGALFAAFGARAIGVKSAHAYERTLAWREREDIETEAALRRLLAGETLSEAERLCLGDWCLARAAELASEHNLPVKIHTGYLAGQGTMQIDHLRAGHLCGLLARYPNTRFVLFHAAYPYGDELVALAKHYPNVYLDLCWAWSIDPWTTSDFVRKVIHTVPSHKLFGFGGDATWPAQSVGYAMQMRRWFIWTLQREINDGFLTEHEAITLSDRFLRANQQECFDIEGTRAAIRAAI